MSRSPLPTVIVGVIAGVVCSLALVAPAYAVEGGLGRSITGLQVTDYAGVVPPKPGWNMALGYVHYSGQFDADRELPISGVATLGMDASFDLYSISAVYVWPTKPGRWNFASLLTVPFADIDLTAHVSAGRLTGRVNDSFKGDLYDISFAPVTAGYHFDEAHHLSLSLSVSAPAGSYDPDRLANPSLNAWVYTPTVAYTQLTSHGTVEWSTSAGIDFSTRNQATNYRSGAVFHVDSQLVKRWPNGWGLGGVGGWIEQIGDDSGPLADRLDGFKGHSLAAGAIVSYSHKHDDMSIAVSLRWLHEFDVSRRLEGDPLMLTGTISF